MTSESALLESGEISGTIKVVQRAVDALIPFARNSRTHSDAQVAQIAASIREFGWTNPVLIDGDDGVIAGHGRLLAARKLGMEQVPAIVLDHLSDAQKRALVIADNQLALNAGWDLDLLGSELKGLGEDGFNLDLLGFGDGLAVLLGQVDAVALPGLPEGDKAPFQQMTFTLHDDQASLVSAALDAAKAQGPFDGPNENSNGNALARICQAFVAQEVSA